MQAQTIGAARAVETGPFSMARVANALVATEASTVQTIVRVALGIVMLPHGAQKLLGWFGGYGFNATLGGLTEGMGLPWIIAFLVIVAESFGALALILGLFGRAAGFGIAAVMAGAAITSHLSNGFFMNWTGTQAGEGYEFHILAAAMGVAVMLRGSGALSLDRLIAARMK